MLLEKDLSESENETQKRREEFARIAGKELRELIHRNDKSALRAVSLSLYDIIEGKSLASRLSRDLGRSLRAATLVDRRTRASESKSHLIPDRSAGLRACAAEETWTNFSPARLLLLCVLFSRATVPRWYRHVFILTQCCYAAPGQVHRAPTLSLSLSRCMLREA